MSSIYTVSYTHLKPARRPARKNTTATKKKTDEAAGKEEKGGKAEKKARAEKKTKSASAETVKVKKSGKNKDGGKDLKQNEHSSKLKIIPLGGLEQIGMNITAFEYEDLSLIHISKKLWHMPRDWM